MRLFYQSYRVSLLIAGLVLFIVAPAAATTITYGANNRPVLFERVSLNGTNFDVTVTWNSTYNTVYSARPPMFLGNEPGSQDAIQVLIQALVDNGHTTSPLQSYLNVPYVNSGNLATSWGVDLFFATLSPLRVHNAIYTSYSNTGFTFWTVAEPVEAESTSWGKIKALFQR
jgi:hypothetical protein